VNARSLVYAGMAIAVAGGGIAASGANAATHRTAAKRPVLPACAKFTDPAGDANFEQNPSGQPADATLDITGVTETVKKGVYTAKIAVPKYSDTSSYSDGSRFDAEFTVGGHVVTLFAIRGKAWAVLSAGFAQQGIRIDGGYVSGTNKVVTSTAANGVVTLTAKLSDISAALGAPVTATSVGSALDAVSWGNYEALSIPFDKATAPTTQTFKFTDCK
jgi:hypothetical protein